MILPKNSTLATVVDFISEEYVRRILEQMTKYGQEKEDIRIMIALDNGEANPNYRFHMVMDQESGEGMPFGSFSGKTHRPLSDKRDQCTHWSDEWMTVKEVSLLLGGIRRAKRLP